MGFGPQHQLVGIRLLVIVGGQRAAVANDGQNAVAPGIVGNAHILGVGADAHIAAGGIQHFAVAVQLDAAAALGVFLGAVDNVGPEVAGQSTIIGGFDVLGGIEAEAIRAGIDAFLQEVQDHALHLGVGGVQVRQTGHAVLGHFLAVAIIIGVLIDVVPAIGVVFQVGNDAVGQTVGTGFAVAHVIGDHVYDDLDAVGMGCLAHADEVGLGAQGTGAGVIDVESAGLVVDPPVVAGMLSGGLLGLLDGRGLDGGVAQSGDGLHFFFDALEGPVPAVQSHAVLNAQRGGISRSGTGRDGQQHKCSNHRQGQNPADGTCEASFHVDSSCFNICRIIIPKQGSIVQRERGFCG